MRKYEVLYILKPDLDEETIKSVNEKIKNIIESANGVIENIDLWKKKKLAYEINKITEGYYVLINFSSNQDLPKELDRNLKIMDNVIRHIIVKQD